MKKIQIIFLLLICPLPIFSDQYNMENVTKCGAFDEIIYKLKKSSQQIIASSVLPNTSNMNYRPENLLDKKYNTCWCPKQGTKGNGIDEFVILKIPFGIKGIEIINGLAANGNFFRENNRVKSLFIGIITIKKSLDENLCPFSWYSIKTGIYHNYNILHDTMIPQRIYFKDAIKEFSWNDNEIFPSKNKNEVYLILAIESIYKGSKYNDTCISEIKIIK